MTQKIRYIGFGALLTGILVVAFSLFYVAKANPSFFMVQNNGTTTTATTSVVYMTPGAATTTKYFDSGQGTANSADSAILEIQQTGSSTVSQINIAFEYARYSGTDCIATPSSCDWYATDLSNQATTSATQDITLAQNFSMKFSSTTQGGAVGAGDGRLLRIVNVPTPTRYVRAIITVPTSSGMLNSGVWAEFIGKRQASN